MSWEHIEDVLTGGPNGGCLPIVIPERFGRCVSDRMVRFVLVALAFHANGRHEAFPSAITVGEEVGLVDSQVRWAWRVLEAPENEYIKCVRPHVKKSRGKTFLITTPGIRSDFEAGKSEGVEQKTRRPRQRVTPSTVTDSISQTHSSTQSSMHSSTHSSVHAYDKQEQEEEQEKSEVLKKFADRQLISEIERIASVGAWEFPKGFLRHLLALSASLGHEAILENLKASTRKTDDDQRFDLAVWLESIGRSIDNDRQTESGETIVEIE